RRCGVGARGKGRTATWAGRGMGMKAAERAGKGSARRGLRAFAPGSTARTTMTGQSEEALLEVPAADLRVYRLTRLVISGNKEIRLTLSPLEWAERFKEGARSSLLFVVGLALVPSGLLYAKLWTNPMAGWVDRDLTHAAVAMLVAAGLAVGFPIGLFLRRRPHRFLAVFADTVI